MAIDTRALGHAAIPWLDLNRVVIATQRKGDRMEKAVVRLGHPFAYGMVRKMAVVANRDMVMAAVLPGIVLRLHRVAIHAAFWIVAQVTGAFAVAERKDAGAGQHSQAD